MAVYYVLGSCLVVWGLGLAIFGLLREDFPPSGPAGRSLIVATVVLVAATITALLVVTDKEHPREEAAAHERERKAEEAGAPGKEPAPGSSEQPSTTPAAPAAQAKTVQVTEKEFSIALAGGNSLQAGDYRFAVRNAGQIEHDLAIQGGGLNETKTKLIEAGQSADLEVELEPARYTFYCSVPGHEQAGMKVAVTVG
jgi:plastocyanin